MVCDTFSGLLYSTWWRKCDLCFAGTWLRPQICDYFHDQILETKKWTFCCPKSVYIGSTSVMKFWKCVIKILRNCTTDSHFVDVLHTGQLWRFSCRYWMGNVQNSLTCILCIYCILFLDNLFKIFDNIWDSVLIFVIPSRFLLDVCCRQLAGCCISCTVTLSWPLLQDTWHCCFYMSGVVYSPCQSVCVYFLDNWICTLVQMRLVQKEWVGIKDSFFSVLLYTNLTICLWDHVTCICCFPDWYCIPSVTLVSLQCDAPYFPYARLCYTDICLDYMQ